MWLCVNRLVKNLLNVFTMSPRLFPCLVCIVGEVVVAVEVDFGNVIVLLEMDCEDVLCDKYCG